MVLITPGYVAAFLCSSYGRLAVRRFTYGTSIKHVEPGHVAEILVPWPHESIRREIGEKFWGAAERRSKVVIPDRRGDPRRLQ